MSVYYILFVLLFTLTTMVHICPCYGNGNVLCIDSERQALLRIKQHLKDSSGRLSSWSSAEMDCCKWNGIVCNNLTGHVIDLNLANPLDHLKTPYATFKRSKLQGTISPSLVDLKHLNYLDLSYNDFGDGNLSIPSFIGSMLSLTYLNLCDTGFQGLIPHQIGNLSNLHHLRIQGDCSRIKAKLNVENLYWLSLLPSLDYLDLSCVNLTAATDWLLLVNTLPSLLELHLNNCNLFVIPSLSRVNFTSLSVLDISENSFGISFPMWIFTLNALTSLDLSGSYFKGPIPNYFNNLTSLMILDLFSNRFDGPLPSSFQNMTALRKLDLEGFNLTNSTIPEWLFNLTNLEYLELSSTNVQGEIPSGIGNLASLSTFSSSDTALEGTIPQTIGNLCNLQIIRLRDNNLRGDISQVFKSFSGCISHSLQGLWLSTNNFSGHIANEIGQLKNLQYLYLADNSISGPLPESMGRLSSLINVDLAGNQLTGTLPLSIGNLSNLQTLDISDNKLQGVVSELHFASLTSLTDLLASNNLLSLQVSPAWVPPFLLKILGLRHWNLGPKFPIWLQSQDNFGFLDLSCTGIADNIPNWFWNLTTHIGYLNLTHNQIHGMLPKNMSFGRMISPVIALGSNQFQGPVPSIVANITFLDLSYNFLSGSLSQFLCHSSLSVEILSLEGNELAGEIPDCWLNWQSLKVIKLGNNNLTGKVPSSVGYLRGLNSLQLRNNNLYGEIPASLGNCTNLLALDLADNYLFGKIPTWMGSSFPSLLALNLRSNKFNKEIPLEICRLTSLQILDFANNDLLGPIPKCVANLTAMVKVSDRSTKISYFISGYYSFSFEGILESAYVVTKGREYEYDRILALLTSMDFSVNKLSGHIPGEITKLLGLRYLNLSENNLTGEIPRNIGDMGVLESADFSRNQISGEIPASMTNIHFLSYLNVSYNNLSGEIPSSTQLQSLDASSFIGNSLCGSPLTKNCSTGEIPIDKGNGSEKEDDGTKVDEFYIGLVVGFVVGFWGIFGSILYFKSWRHPYFRFLNKVWLRLRIAFDSFTC